MKINYKVLITSILIVFSIAFIGSLFTSSNTNSAWYLANKPSITPPNFVFPIVWNILYLLIAISLYSAWTNIKTKKDKNQKKKIAIVFGINLILNVVWSLLFFTLQLPLFAFIVLIAIWLTIFAMMFVVKKVSKISAWMLVPYAVWVGFAGVLNFLWMI